MSRIGRASLDGRTAVLAILVVVGCAAVSRAAAAEGRPSFAEAKAIAEEGFIYGLPIVMNYAVMYEYAVDRKSGQFKAPFNQIKNEARVFTYKDTGQYPPVNAFWSVTMYDGKTQLLIENPINRYLINSPMLPELKKNEDGSLTLNIQKSSPAPEKQSNWLPAPDGPIYLVMRLYWPKTEPPSVLPTGEGTWKPPGVAVAK